MRVRAVLIVAGMAIAAVAVVARPTSAPSAQTTAAVPSSQARIDRIAPGPVPGATWTIASPDAEDLDAKALEAFSRAFGGRGVVVRRGQLVYQWGEAARRGDVASAAKPVYGFFLFKAIASGRLDSLDVRASTVVPELEALNPPLGFKDRRITFRHVATQTSGYGVTEAPGAAFDYNDWQMALFWDTLFLGVWRTSYAEVDRAVLDPELCDLIHCEDDPTFLAFGEADRAGRLAISPRDFARVALLYLRGGIWNNTQVLPAAMVRESLHSPLPNSIPQTTGVAAPMLPGQRTIGSSRVPDNQTDHLGSYSFMWWVNGVDREGRRLLPDAPPDTFMASGHGARRVAVVVPSLDLVATWNDTNVNGWPAANQAIKALLASVK
jgi:CubicO group peptidase (beta-lactamase class C family)